MNLSVVDSAIATTETLRVLGCGAAISDLVGTEALCASIRRAASFMCPTTPGALARAVADAMQGLPGVGMQTYDDLREAVDVLTSYGDLIELPLEEDGRKVRHLFLGPPSYVRRGEHPALLVGVRPDGAPIVGDDLVGRVRYQGHARFFPPIDGRPPSEVLAGERLVELDENEWAQGPRPCSPSVLLKYYESRLVAAPEAGDLMGVQILDPSRPVKYYKGRWRPLSPTDNGQFVARRPQQFGADAWCYLGVIKGEPDKVLDLPCQSPLARGSDEAWRLQAAIDATAALPQLLRVGLEGGQRTLELFSPVPSWIQRRLDVVGTKVAVSRGALITYVLGANEAAHEEKYLREMMWMSTE